MAQFYDKHGVLREGDINAHLEAERARWQADVRARQSAAWRRKAFRTAAGGAALFGGGMALSSILAPGAAASGAGAAGSAAAPATFNVPASIGATTAPAAAGTAATSATAGAATAGTGLARLGSIFNSPGMELGVNAGLSLFGLRSQNKANAQARADTLCAQQQAIELQLKDIDERRRAGDLDREEARRLNDQAHALQVRQIQLAEQDAAYRREIDARDDARLQPYRAISAQAMRRLASIWGI